MFNVNYERSTMTINNQIIQKPHPNFEDDEPTSKELENIDEIFQDMEDDDFYSIEE